MIKNVLIGFIVLILAITIILLVTLKFVPGDKIKAIVGEDNQLADILCIYPIKVKGDSMGPAISDGEYIVFNKCLDDKSDISDGTVVLYQFGSRLLIGRIRGTQGEDDSLEYKISSDNEKDNIYEIPSDDVMGVFYENN